MQIVLGIASLVNFVVALIVLVKLFQKEGLMKGVLGLFCMIYTFYWGWKNSKEQNLTTLMWVWTGLIVLNVVAGALSGMGGGSSDAGQGFLLHLI